MRILLLGGGGYIGSHLCKRLHKKHDLTVLDTDFSKLKKVAGEISGSLITQDLKHITDSELQQLCNSSDIVVDLIAHATPSKYVSAPLDVVSLNYDENMRVVRACAHAKTRLVQFSSCEVYGLSVGDLPFSEDISPMVVGPICESRWIYACAKQLLERMVHAYGQSSEQLNWSIIRPFNFIGPEMDYVTRDLFDTVPRVLPQFISSLLYGRAMRLVNGGVAKRTFTYIDDAIDGCELVIENKNDQFTREIVNIGTKGNEC